MYFITSVAKDDTRCVGYVSTLEEAIDIVENNRYDLNEAGCYPWCVIEHIREGIYHYDFKPHWFEYNDYTNKYIEREHRPPFIDNNSVGFAIRLERNCFYEI